MIHLAIATCLLLVQLGLYLLTRRRAKPAPRLRVQVFANGSVLLDADAATLAELIRYNGGKPDMHRFRGDVVVGFRVDG